MRVTAWFAFWIVIAVLVMVATAASAGAQHPRTFKSQYNSALGLFHQ